MAAEARVTIARGSIDTILLTKFLLLGGTLIISLMLF